MAEKFDVASMIADRLISQMEKGEVPWQKPWVGAGRCVARNQKPYSLLNHLLLGRPGEYITWKQAEAEGGKIKEGEEKNYSIVVHWTPPRKKSFIKVNDAGEEEVKEYWKKGALTYFRVYHIDQTEGIVPKYAIMPETHAEPFAEGEQILENYIERTGIRLQRDKESDRAYYSPTFDQIVVPKMEQFAHTAEFYSTTFHEMTHSTGHETRLNRLSKEAAFGNEVYSKEELVAEIGAATLCQHCGISTESSFQNSAAYLKSWLKALKDDKTMIVSAATLAEKAVKYILNKEDKNNG